MKAAVIGSPVTHSLSPAIFAQVSQHQKMALDYTSRDVLPQDLPAFIQELRHDPAFLGVNVTLPLKEAALKACDQLSAEAAAIGAVNVIHHHAGQLTGYNTDVMGIQKTLADQHFSVRHQTCLLLGAGGSARAMAYVLGKGHAQKVLIYNPRSQRGEILAQQFGALFPKTQFGVVATLKQVTEPIGLVVNTTPVGMHSTPAIKPPHLSIFQDLSHVTFAPEALAFDVIYTPAMTPFLQRAVALGLTPIGGLGMLIAQALATWEIWNGKISQARKLHQLLQQQLRGILYLREHPAPLFLTGLMGAGKTTVGQALAQLTQRTFWDTDQLIEAQTGKTIAELFRQKGETYFRQLEKKAVAQAAKTPQAIVALGGGAVMTPENQKIIAAAGPLIHLYAHEDTLAQRLTDSAHSRPLLAGLNATDKAYKLKELYTQRSAAYSQALLTLDTTPLSPLAVAQSILVQLADVVSTPLVTLQLPLRNQVYPILIGENALQVLPDFLRNRSNSKIFVISDAQLIPARKTLLSQLASQGFVVHEIPVTAGEKLKDIDAVYPLYGELLTKKADRNAVILALGGGTVGDVAGFIAATYMRGIEWVSLPTTLLAQVDSGVGGKTGINHASGKNLIGAFHQPALVICDTLWLKTLGRREMISGLGEIVKYAIAFDPDFFGYLEKNILSVLQFDAKVLQHCIERSLFWKCKWVAKDECDRTGLREQLNLGHTFAHALEAATHYHTYQHGEAVIWGLRFAVALSVRRGHLSVSASNKMQALLRQLEVPPLPPKLRPTDIFAYMKKDKKAEGNHIRFVLLEKMGKTISDSGVNPEDLLEAFQTW